jgi:hypothetical protein
LFGKHEKLAILTDGQLFFARDLSPPAGAPEGAPVWHQ